MGLQSSRFLAVVSAAVVAAVVVSGGSVAEAGSFVRFGTSMGRIDIALDPTVADTVQNFKGYVVRGDYDRSFIHRQATPPSLSIIQGGGFGFDGDYFAVPLQPTIRDDPRFDNVRGTISMARQRDDPLTPMDESLNTATSQWFVNVADNTADLPAFSVFGRIPPDSMQVVDAIAALPVISGNVTVDAPFAGNFSALPVRRRLAPFTSECAIFTPPVPPFYDLNGIDNCPDDASFAAAIQARIAARGPDVPGRLVYINRAIVLPSTWGRTRIRLDAPIRILRQRPHTLWADMAGGDTFEGVLPRRHLVGISDLDAEWFVETNDEAMRAVTQSGSLVTGTLEPRGSSKRRLTLELDEEAAAALLAETKAEIERSLVERALFLRLLGLERIEDGIAVVEGDTENAPTATVTLEIVGEPKARLVERNGGNAVRAKGRLQFRGTATTKIYYRPFGPPAVPGEPNRFASSVTRPISGDILFKVKGNFARLF